MIKRICFILCVLTTPAFAQQNITPDDIGERFLERREREREKQLLQQAPTDLSPKERPGLKTKKDDGPCFPVNEITLKDNSKLKSKITYNVFTPYLDRGCVTVQDIRVMMVSLTNAYIDAGYVTSKVYIKKTDLSDKKLELIALEGVIEEMTVNEEDKSIWRWRNGITRHAAFPLLKGRVLSIKDIEQGTDQIARLLSSDVQAKLYPGKNAGGTKVVVTNNAKDTVRGHVTFDNFGQKTTGKRRIRATVETDQLFGLNDQLLISYIGAQDTNAIVLNGSIGIGYWTHSASYSYSEYLTLISNIDELFGSTHNANFTTNRVIYRGRKHQLSLEAALNLKESGRIINNVTLAPQSLTVARAGIIHRYIGNGFYVRSEGTYSRGLDTLGALSDPSGLADAAPHAQFDKVDASIDIVKPIAPSFTLDVTASGQYSPQSLYGSEQIVMGDYYTVRGFSGSEVAGDMGGYTRVEAQLKWTEGLKSILPEKFTQYTSPYSFMDAGAARLAHGDTDVAAMAGYGAGLKFNVWRFSGDLGVSAPIAYTDDVYDPGIEGYVNITTKLF